MKNFNSLLMVIALAALACCNNSTAKRTRPATATGTSPAVQAQSSPLFTAVLFSNDTLPGSIKATGYGYNIYRNGKLYIHQPMVPAANGNTGFATAEKAAATARLVIFRMEHNIIPPAITMAELDSLALR